MKKLSRDYEVLAKRIQNIRKERKLLATKEDRYIEFLRSKLKLGSFTGKYLEIILETEQRQSVDMTKLMKLKGYKKFLKLVKYKTLRIKNKN